MRTRPLPFRLFRSLPYLAAVFCLGGDFLIISRSPESRQAWALQTTDAPQPKTMYAAHRGAEIWSSAEEGRYVVARLAEATPVEVYERLGEWFSIRPPEGCFSWVPAAAVAETDTPGVVQVISQGARSWVGGEDERSTPPRPQSSVQLDRGERLIRLGQWDLTTPSGRIVETWVRISPPAGEFRWVHRDDVATTPPAPRPDDDAPETATEPMRPVGWTEESAADPVSTDRRTGSSPDSGRDERSAPPLDDLSQRPPRIIEPVQGRPLASPRLDDAQPRRGSMAEDRWVARSATSTTASDGRQRDADRVEWSLDTTADFEVQVAQLQLRLSQEVARDPFRWNVQPLKQAAEQLVDSGQSALQRGKARRLLEELRSLEHLQRRYERMRRGDAAAMETSLVQADDERANAGSIQQASRSTPTGDNEAPPPTRDVAFDREGWLVPVESRSGAAPPYALVDEDGALLCLLTPSPGLNVRPFLKQHVGVFGTTTLLPALKTTHITAREVVETR